MRGRATAALGAAVLVFVGACADEDPQPEAPEGANSEVTYYEHLAPILEKRCLGCHQAGGLGPFRLDDYETARDYAPLIRASTHARTMPPYLVKADGSCGDFRDPQWLSDEELDLIARWEEAGAPEGTPKTFELPELPQLSSAKEYSTPVFVPEPAGGLLAEHDEYRCFLLDADVAKQQFITAYDVVPGLDSVVHHALAMIVDPDEMASVPDEPELTNLELMERLDAESPDREGWPCFGMAGDGVEVRDVPTTWAPGEGLVRYPGNSGILLKPTDKVVLQVHYNLVDRAEHGKPVQTKVRFELADEVPNVGFFVLADAFLNSLFSEEESESLAAGQKSVRYSWEEELSRAGVASGTKLYGVFPHMHERGKKYTLNLVDGDTEQCAADVQRWDFHWQHMYFYNTPFVMGERTGVKITCDYDTSRDDAPTYPGWGTRNEMCFVALYFTTPAGP